MPRATSSHGEMPEGAEGVTFSVWLSDGDRKPTKFFVDRHYMRTLWNAPT
jgi:hypothetical protein